MINKIPVSAAGGELQPPGDGAVRGEPVGVELVVFRGRGRGGGVPAGEHRLHDRRPRPGERLHAERGGPHRRRGGAQRRQLVLLRPGRRHLLAGLVAPPRLGGPRVAREPQRDIRLGRAGAQVPGQHPHGQRVDHAQLRPARPRHGRRERRLVAARVARRTAREGAALVHRGAEDNDA